MTSSAASDTDSARNRVVDPGGRRSGAATSRPLPPGRCTSSSTTSGRVAVITRDRRVDVLGLADDVDGVAELGAHAGAEHPVVVDEHDPRRAASVMRSLPRRAASVTVALAPATERGISSWTSVPSPAAVTDHGAPAVALHPAR